MKEKSIYYFSNNKCDGSLKLINILGGKGANLAEMCKIGIPVPPGFTISTVVCKSYYTNNVIPQEIIHGILKALKFLEEETSCKFGDSDNPLLLSVRSGSIQSMPGMLDTILNVGLNDQSVKGLSKKSGERFAYDSYRRFIQMYSNVVLGIEHYLLEEVIDTKKRDYNIKNDSELSAKALKEIVEKYKEIVLNITGKIFPQDAYEQLHSSIIAVFRSWMNDRAVAYREIHNIPDNFGTAVNIQSMVFGNIDNNSATGVIFSRNPTTGDKSIFGEFLLNAQGEDIVAGTRTPLPIDLMKDLMPNIYYQLTTICNKLESHYRNMQDIEFTVESNKLSILQTRNGKRTSQAAVKIAVDMVNEGLISKQEAILRIDPEVLSNLLHPVIENNNHDSIIIGKGLPASPGAVSGLAVFNSSDAEKFKKEGHKVILVRTETNPEDIRGMSSSVGIVTTRGGMTSHAAVVARGMGKPCICSVSGISIDKNEEFFITEKGVKIYKSDFITINGNNGELMSGIVKTTIPKLSKEFDKLMNWADEIRTIKVMANADTPTDVKTAIKFKADGIGLCRTEHMFFSDERITTVQEMIIADNDQERKLALNKLESMQKEDFKDIFLLMQNKPVTIRLLDPPLHEFLPGNDEAILEISNRTGKLFKKLKNRICQLSEKNPMLGHRGCRLAISYPEIYEMQIKAVFSAIKELKDEKKIENVTPEIMIPLIMDEKELLIVNSIIHKVSYSFSDIKYSIGTMIELPRAALTADKIAKHVKFLSFGTNDLTQTTLGLSRDDSSSFIGKYKEMGILQHDPFEVLDIEGVGQLIKIAVVNSRKVFPHIKIGICGEHGGNPKSIEFCSQLNLDYISCSPYRIAVARLAAAQCKIKQRVLHKTT